MRKTYVSVLCLLLVFCLFGCSSAPSGIKTIDAFGVRISVPSSWSSLEDTTADGLKLFETTAVAASVKSDVSEVMVVMAVGHTGISFSDLHNQFKLDKSVEATLIQVNGLQMLRVDALVDSEMTITLILNTGPTVTSIVVITVEQSEYDSNQDIYEAIINSITVG